MKLPLLKKSLLAAQRVGHRILLGTPLYASGVELQDDDNDSIWYLLSLMNGKRTIPQIIRAMQKKDPELEKDTIEDAIDDLLKEGFIEDAGAPHPENISPQEAKRYSRNASFFSWVDRQKRESPYTTQSILKQSKVTIIGLGGIGSAVALSLTALGIGDIYLVDSDRVESSNLNRQLLYTEDDIGKEKVTAAVISLQKRNSQIAITGQSLHVDSLEVMESLFSGRSLITLCADEPYEKLREWANAAALRTHTPWIEAYSGGPQCAMSLFVPFKTPCYACVVHFAREEEKSLQLVDPSVIDRRLEIQPVIAPTAAIIGDLIALQACYFLMGIKPYIMGRQYRQNLLELDHIISAEAKFWRDCPLCGEKGRYKKTRKIIHAEKRISR